MHQEFLLHKLLNTLMDVTIGFLKATFQSADDTAPIGEPLEVKLVEADVREVELVEIDEESIREYQESLRHMMPRKLSPEEIEELLNIVPDVKTVEGSRASKKAAGLLSLLLDEKDRDAVIGDLCEKYEEKQNSGGKRRADLWFYYEVVRSTWPFLRQFVVRISGRVRTRRAE